MTQNFSTENFPPEHPAKAKLRFALILFVIIVLPLGVLTATWYSMKMVSRVTPSERMLAEPGDVLPAFFGISQWGDTLDNAFVLDRVTLVSFFDAECGASCIDALLRVEEIENALNKYKELRILSLCLNPQEADPARIQLLRRRLGTDTFWHLLAPENPNSSRAAAELAGFDPDDPQRPFGASMLIDRKGRLRGRYDVLEESSLQDVVNDAVYLLAHAD